MSNFSERLRDLILEEQISVAILATQIKFSQGTVFSWQSNTTQPYLSGLIAVADYFKCDLDYIVGRTDIPRDITPPKIYPPFAKQLRKIMKEVGKSEYWFRHNTKFGAGVFYQWERNSQPTISTLIDLANILEVTIDYLVGRE